MKPCCRRHNCSNCPLKPGCKDYEFFHTTCTKDLSLNPQMFDDIQHNINNSLTILIGNMSLHRKDLTPKTKELLQILQKEAEYINHYTESLKQYIRKEAA